MIPKDQDQDQDLSMEITDPLVNIPVLEEGNREILREIGKKGLIDNLHILTRSGRKRAAGKKNQAGHSGLVESYGISVGTKKTWKLQDESEDDHKMFMEKNVKKQKSGQNIGYVQIGEASLIWS